MSYSKVQCAYSDCGKSFMLLSDDYNCDMVMGQFAPSLLSYARSLFETGRKAKDKITKTVDALDGKTIATGKVEREDLGNCKMKFTKICFSCPHCKRKLTITINRTVNINV